MKLADMQVLEACPARGAGSNPARATFYFYGRCFPMNLDQYFDKIRFPLSTIPGLAQNEQFNADAESYDFLVEQKEKGIPLTEEQLRLWDEFEIKIPHLFRLSTEFWASSHP